MYTSSQQVKPLPKRDTWATQTIAQLTVIVLREQELNEEKKLIKARCNHTYEDGTSALETHDDWDNHGGSTSYTRCEACGCTI